MAASCTRPADCLAGNRTFHDAVRGLRAAPAPAPRRPVQKQQDAQVPTTGSISVATLSRPRPNGRQRRRRSPSAAGSPPTQKRVMENVVILKRGEQIPTTVSAKSGEQGVKDENGVAVVAAVKQSGAEAGTAEHVAAGQRQQQSSAQAGIVAEPTTAAGQRGAETEAKEAKAAAEQHPTDATNVTKAKVVVGARQAKEGENVRAVAKRSGGQRTKAGAVRPAVYSGPSFAAAPEPHELPIPLVLLQGRGARLRQREEAGCAVATAPAA